MKNIRLTMLIVLLAVLIIFGAQAQVAKANQQLAISHPSIGLQQASTPAITVNVTAQINNPAQPAPPSSGNNTGLILIVIVVVLVLIILVGILIGSRRPTDV